MKVEIKLSDEVTVPYAVIYTNTITEEIQKINSYLSKKDAVVLAYEEDSMEILAPQDIYMIRAENSNVMLYTEHKTYRSKKRLFELEDLLGVNFMRISKSTIVNLKQLKRVEPAFNGLMLLILKNGCKDYISRKYLGAFKSYLGL